MKKNKVIKLKGEFTDKELKLIAKLINNKLIKV